MCVELELEVDCVAIIKLGIWSDCNLVAITAIGASLVVAGCTGGDSIGACLHVPEEGFAQLDSCCAVLDIDVEVCWHRNRYRIQRYRKDGNKSTGSGWSGCLRICRKLCVQLGDDREATEAEGRYTA